jgi:hypothetical protein
MSTRSSSNEIMNSKSINWIDDFDVNVERGITRGFCYLIIYISRFQSTDLFTNYVNLQEFNDSVDLSEIRASLKIVQYRVVR